jgi:ribonuclease P protein component
VKRSFRLTSSTDFKRVRRFGKSHAHPLVVLIALPREDEQTLFGVAAGRSVWKAVQRNRAKRRLRAALQPALPRTAPGWDVVLIARPPLLKAPFSHVQVALTNLLKRADLLQESHDNRSSSGK